MAKTNTATATEITVELPFGRETDNTVRYEIPKADNPFKDFAITPLYIQKTGLRAFYEANGHWPQDIRVTVELL